MSRSTEVAGVVAYSASGEHYTVVKTIPPNTLGTLGDMIEAAVATQSLIEPAADLTGGPGGGESSGDEGGGEGSEGGGGGGGRG